MGAGADDYDQGVKVDKQYDEQQDKLTNCTPQSSVEGAPHVVLADFAPGQSAFDAATLSPMLIRADVQLAWGSGGGSGGGGNGGGKGPDRNPKCP